jgi:hypothetical protein
VNWYIELGLSVEIFKIFKQTWIPHAIAFILYTKIVKKEKHTQTKTVHIFCLDQKVEVKQTNGKWLEK